tara:strand:- start:5725 stop:6441 length:717 start_codon:yes stop_codon:yes gene_type:complete
MNIKLILKNNIKYVLSLFGYSIVNKEELVDYILYKYSSYDEYRNTQIFHNKKKIDSVWADKHTLKRVVKIVLNEFSSRKKISGLCHGTRNGFEQNYMHSLSNRLNVLGTDISDTAKNYENSIQWDFHDINDKWVNSQEFIYTNSLDQSWQPKLAVHTWLSQLKPNGILIIEHTHGHGPKSASKMDPFGVRPTTMPYVLSMWFGHQISIEHSVEKKSNVDLDAWLFVIKKNVKDVKFID